MTPMPSAIPVESKLFGFQARIIYGIVKRSVSGLSHQESLISPPLADSCLNWVVGNLVRVYEELLPVLGQESVISTAAVARYGRGTPSLLNHDEALPISVLAKAWDRIADALDTGLMSLTSSELEAPAPFSPIGDPDETVRSLIAVILLHQATHAGQAGLLRKIAGQPGIA